MPRDVSRHTQEHIQLTNTRTSHTAERVTFSPTHLKNDMVNPPFFSRSCNNIHQEAPKVGSDPCHMMWVVSRHPLPNTPKHTTSVFAPRDLFFYMVNPPFFLASRQVLIHTITPVPSNVGPRVGGTRYGPTRFGLGPARKHKFYLSLFAHMDWQQNYDQMF